MGNQVDAAPLDLVADPGALALSLSPEINYLSCHNCHARVLEPFVDEVAEKVAQDPNFGVLDRQKVAFWHGRKAALRAKMGRDEAQFAEATQDIGLGPNENDPINAYVNRLRQESSLEQVAALVNLKPPEFASKLRSAPRSQGEFGQLLNGNTVTLQQLQSTLQIFVVEANIFRNDFGE